MKLKQMREQAGLTQSELSLLSGVNLRSLQDYEQGHKSLNSAKGDTLLRLSHILGYSIEDILQGSIIECNTSDAMQEQMNQRLMAYERCLRSRKEEVVHFPVIADDELVDMSRIYPTKQSEVKQVLAGLRGDANITELRLFGSSITMACHKNSDVDFAVGLRKADPEIRNYVSEIIQQACDWKADIIWMDHLSSGERIYKDIMRGLVLI